MTACLGTHLNRWDTRIYALQFTGRKSPGEPVSGHLHALCAASGGRAAAVPSLRSALHRMQELDSKLQCAGPKVHLQVGRPGDECTIAALSGSGGVPMRLRTRQITPRQLGGRTPGTGVWPIPEPFLPCRGVTAVEESSAGAVSSQGGTRRPKTGLPEVPKHLLPPRPAHPTLVLLPDATPHNKEAVAHVLHKLAFPADVYDVQKCAVTDALFAAHSAAAQQRNRAARAAAAAGQVPPDELSASVAWSVAVSGSGTTRSWHMARRRAHALQCAAARAAQRQASTSRRSPEAQWRHDSAVHALVAEDASFAHVLREHGAAPAATPAGADACGPWEELWQGHNTPLRTRCGFLAMSEDKLVRDLPAAPTQAPGGGKSLMGVLVLLPWDYHTLFELLAQLHESAQAMPRAAEVAWRRRHKQPYKPGSLPLLAHAAETEPVWRQAFTDYLERVPGYYLAPLLSALAPYCLDQVARDCLLPPGQQDVMAGLVRCHRHMPPVEALDWLAYAQKSTEQLSAELNSTTRVPPLSAVTGFHDVPADDGSSDASSVCSTGSVSSLVSTASGYSYASGVVEGGGPHPEGGVQPTERTAASMNRHSVPAQLMSNYTSKVQHAVQHGLRNPLAEDPEAQRSEALRPLFGNPYAFRAGRRPGQRGLLLGQLSAATASHAPADEMDMLASNDAALLSDGAPGAAARAGAVGDAPQAASKALPHTGASASAAKLSALGGRLRGWVAGSQLSVAGCSLPPPPAAVARGGLMQVLGEAVQRQAAVHAARL